MRLYFLNIRRFYPEDIGQHLQERRQPGEPGGHRSPAVRLHRPVHLSHAEPGRAQVLDPGPAAASSASACCWGKFAFSATWSLLIAEFLVVFSD